MSSYKLTKLTTILPPQLSEHIPYIFDDFSLALHLGIRCKTLWYCVVKKPYLYRKFTIPKANGKARIIYDPYSTLKYVQRRINEVILQSYPVSESVGAYVPGRGCLDSAKRHTGHAIRVGFDIKDFFPTHHRTWVRNFFMRTFGYSHYVSGILADLCTVREIVNTPAKSKFRHFVPQGSPASPALCNLMAQEVFDAPLLQTLEGTGWVYTRYADDLTLSHPETKSRAEVDALIACVYELLGNAGYKPNRKKLRIQRRHRQQKMLGIVVNVQPNIPQCVYRKYRAILHNCKRDGFYVAALQYGYDPPEAFVSHLQGKLSYFQSVNVQKAQKLLHTLKCAQEIYAQEIHVQECPNPE